MYADTDFFLALVKDDDWLKEKAERVLEEYEGEIRTSLTTFIELSFLAEEYDWDMEKVAAYIMEIVKVDFDENVVFQAIEYRDKGLNTIDAFQAANASENIISSDKDYDKINLERVKLEEQ